MNAQLETRINLSTLWIVVMFTMVFADILTFITPGALNEIMNNSTGIELTSSLLLVFAILLEIPILMIYLSRKLTYSINRWANIIAAIITILFVIGGGSLTPHYIFFAGVETLCMLWIIVQAWNWRE